MIYPRRASELDNITCILEQRKNTVTVVPTMLQVATCSVHNVMHILLYTAVEVVDAHITKYQIGGIIRTLIREYI